MDVWCSPPKLSHLSPCWPLGGTIAKWWWHDHLWFRIPPSFYIGSLLPFIFLLFSHSPNHNPPFFSLCFNPNQVLFLFFVVVNIHCISLYHSNFNHCLSHKQTKSTNTGLVFLKLHWASRVAEYDTKAKWACKQVTLVGWTE